MKLGVALRTMGPQSTAETLLACARAERVGLDELWVPDQIAIPPDDAAGSGGRYLDPLAALAWLAAKTERMGIGSAVLILPYRAALPTAKAIAAIQELSGGRLTLGVGVGWMEPEFRALGVPVRAFASDEVEAHGQKFLFLPRPRRPAILVGGAPGVALARAARFGDGWIPLGLKPAALAPHVRALREAFAAAGKPAPRVAVGTRFPFEDPPRARARTRIRRSRCDLALPRGSLRRCRGVDSRDRGAREAHPTGLRGVDCRA